MLVSGTLWNSNYDIKTHPRCKCFLYYDASSKESQVYKYSKHNESMLSLLFVQVQEHYIVVHDQNASIIVTNKLAMFIYYRTYDFQREKEREGHVFL